MNIDALHTIFANYIRKFDIINNKQHDENYKWRMAARFPSIMNPDGPDFISGMKEAAKSKLFSNGHFLPLSALVKYAETDENAVRDLFRALFADDGGSLIARQRKIDKFVSGANILIPKAYPEYKNASQFENNQRSAMSYLFFNDPEHHYLYKYTVSDTGTTNAQPCHTCSSMTRNIIICTSIQRLRNLPEPLNSTMIWAGERISGWMSITGCATN